MHFRCLPSEGTLKTALLGGQSAQRKIAGVVHSSEKYIFLEMTYKIFVFTAYQVRGFCECTHWPFVEVFNERIATLCISLKIKNIKKSVSFCPSFCAIEKWRVCILTIE